LTYNIPASIAAGNAMQFSIDVRANVSVSCDNNTIALRTEEGIPVIICPTAPGGVCASVGVITGSANTALTVDRPSLNFTALTGNVTSKSPGKPESYSVNFSVNNAGTANMTVSNPLTVDFYCADGGGNPTGDLLSTYTSPVSLPIGGTFSATYTFKANGCSPAGNLAAVISKGSNCICSQVVRAFHANVIPVAGDDNPSTPEDTPVTFNIISNDMDADGAIVPGSVDLDILTPGIQTTLTIPGQGTFTLNATNGDLTFVPVANYNGLVTPVTYQVCDNGVPAMCTQAIITVTVTPIDDAPLATNDVISTNEDTPVNGNAATNDTPSGDGGNVWSLTGVNGGAAHGTVTMNNDGTYTFTPAANYFGKDTFIYKVCDADGDCSSATVTITVNPVQDPPVALADNFGTKENKKLTGNVLVNDYDVDGDQISVDITPVLPPAHGALVLNPNGDFTYQPVIDFLGNDTFTYRICDNGTPSLCATALVTIVVSKDESCAVFVPNSFSPNGDGIHDYFKVRCLYNYENPIIEIYNRWGNLVFKKDHYGDVDFWGSEADAWWTGRSDHKWTVGDELLPVGTYYYVLKLNSSKVLTGFLFLNK